MKSLSQPAVNMNRTSYGILFFEQNKLSISMCEHSRRFNAIRKEMCRRGWLRAPWICTSLLFVFDVFHLNKCGNFWSPSQLSNVLCCVLRKMKWQSTKCIDVSGGRGQNEVIKRELCFLQAERDTAYKLDFHRHHLKCICHSSFKDSWRPTPALCSLGGFVFAPVWEPIFLLFSSFN